DVPEQVSILGVDNDELLCKSAGPSLSSVDVDNYRAGFLAAELLDSLIKGKTRSPRTVCYPPVMVGQRQSTEAPQYDDPLVNDVLLQIWSSHGCGFSLQEVADQQNVSRRILEVRFRAQTGRSTLDEVQSVRLTYICSLLRRSEITISDIVKMCGFTSQCYLAQFFKKKMGKTMSDYRRETLGDDFLD
ncbi:MAG: helix-turn-helix domain-containing protein, partial [Thermoguttaceae bacterium]|nr:helix-turn-helix domain-containing protein [Thermoguttaceae bacterium]